MYLRSGLCAIIFISIFATTTSFANYSHFTYKKKDSNLTKESFYRWARPQARNIVSDFFTILKKLDPIHTNLIALNKQVQKLSYSWQDLNEKCFKISDVCREDFKQFYLHSRKVDSLILKIRENNVDLSSVTDSEKLDSLVALTKGLNKIAILNYELLHYLEETLMTSGTSFEAYTNSKGRFVSLIHYMKITSKLILTAQVDKRYKKDFDFIWINFMSKLDYYIVHKKDKKYLEGRLEDLNIAWNSFHMKMAKGNKGFPKVHIKLVSIMHSRWNSILKLILRD